MLKEISLQDVYLSEDDIKEGIKEVSSSDVNLISCHADSISKVRDAVKNTKIEVSQLLDFPLGCSGVDIKLDMISSAFKYGVKYVDVPLNSVLLYRRKWTKIIDESRACLDLCVQYKMGIRLFVEPFLLDEPQILKLAGLLTEVGINTIILGSGTKHDDVNDTIITAFNITKKIGLNTIITINRTLRSEQIDTIRKTSIHGVRFTNFNLAKSLLIVPVS